MRASPTNILIVGQDVRVVAYTRSRLEDRAPHCRFTYAESCEAALTSLSTSQTESPDLIVVVERQLGPGCMKLVLALQEDPAQPTIPLVLLSPDITDRDAKLYHWLGAFYVQKSALTDQEVTVHIDNFWGRFVEGLEGQRVRAEAPIRVLLIEDNRGDATLVREALLEAAGSYRLYWLQYLEEGLELLAAIGDACDVVLLDLSLPDAPGGWDTLAHFRAKAPEVPVVVVTGLEDEGQALDALHQGANDYLYKRMLEPVTIARSIRYTVARNRMDRIMIQAGEAAEEAQVEAVMNKLAAGVAHHVNNLLTIVLGHGMLASETLDMDHPARQDLQQMISAAERIGQLTQQIQASGSRSLANFAVTDLNQLIRDLLPRFRRLCGDAVTLNLELADSPMPARIDRALIEGAVSELIENSVAAMPTGGTMTLRTYLRAPQLDPYAENAFSDPVEGVGKIYLEVEDSGEGMSAEQVDQAFQPFWTTRADQNRAGMGLASVYGITKQHGAEIRLKSHEGQGTTVSIAFSAAPRSARPQTSLIPPPGLTILVVDDETMFREFAVRMLTSLDHTVLAVANGGQALDMAARHQGTIDVVLCDVMIPGLGALETVHALQADRPDLHALFMTGANLPAVMKEGIDPQRYPILNKPFSRSTIARSLGEVLMQPLREPAAVSVTSRPTAAHSTNRPGSAARSR